MEKQKMVIVGSGWRSLYYVRIAKALPEYFELSAMLCRTEEKAKKMAEENDIYTTTSIQECIDMKPDFVVVVVNKASIADVTKEWVGYGCTVLCETPASLDLDTLNSLWELHKQGGKIYVAEQYTHYPEYKAISTVLNSNIIGEPYALNISLAHEYHGASLIREFLRENPIMENANASNMIADTSKVTGFKKFTVSAKMYSHPTMETLTRYESFTDGRVADKKRCVATFEFEDGKVAFYDFNSEQYRSPIRRNTYKVQGERGELRNDVCDYMDKDNKPVSKEIEIASNTRTTDSENPNFKEITEITDIKFNGVHIYTPMFGECGLPSDETAIAELMYNAGKYSKGEEEQAYPLRYALQDAYMAILLDKAVKTGEVIESETQSWG